MKLADLEQGHMLYSTDGTDVWRLLYWCNEPTVTLENVETKEQRGGAVYSLNMREFKKLIIEEK